MTTTFEIEAETTGETVIELSDTEVYQAILAKALQKAESIPADYTANVKLRATEESVTVTVTILSIKPYNEEEKL